MRVRAINAKKYSEKTDFRDASTKQVIEEIVVVVLDKERQEQCRGGN